MRSDVGFPGPAALWPCLATAALIWVGANRRAGASRWLSVAPLRWIGAHSFSLYRWHWPVLVLMRHVLLDQPTPVQTALAVALSVVLGICLLAHAVPARRAAAVNPGDSLRAE